MTINNIARILPRKTKLAKPCSALRRIMGGMFRDPGKEKSGSDLIGAALSTFRDSTLAWFADKCRIPSKQISNQGLKCKGSRKYSEGAGNTEREQEEGRLGGGGSW